MVVVVLMIVINDRGMRIRCDLVIVRATHTLMLLVPRVAQINSLPIKIQIRLARGQ